MRPIYIYSFIISLLSSYLFLSTSFAEDKNTNLHAGVFLIASEQVEHNALSKSVIYITQNGQAGSTGFIVNRPMDVDVNKAFPGTKASNATNKVVFFGGPLHTQYMFMLTQTQFGKGLFKVDQDVFFATGQSAVMRLQSNNTRDKIRTYAGFMSWGPGQLEDEISKKDWVVAPANPEQIFTSDPDKLWKKLYTRWAGSWI